MIDWTVKQQQDPKTSQGRLPVLSYIAKVNPSPAGYSFFAPFAQGGNGSACDLNQDGVVNIVDVQLAIDMYLGVVSCPSTINIDSPGVCNQQVVTQVQNAALNQPCVTANSHTVTLNWTASTTTGATYNVYRSTTSGGPYVQVGATPANTVTFADTTVVAGTTYYYVTTAVYNGVASVYSNQATAVVPFP